MLVHDFAVVVYLNRFCFRRIFFRCFGRFGDFFFVLFLLRLGNRLFRSLFKLRICIFNYYIIFPVVFLQLMLRRLFFTLFLFFFRLAHGCGNFFVIFARRKHSLFYIQCNCFETQQYFFDSGDNGKLEYYNDHNCKKRKRYNEASQSAEQNEKPFAGSSEYSAGKSALPGEISTLYSSAYFVVSYSVYKMKNYGADERQKQYHRCSEPLKLLHEKSGRTACQQTQRSYICRTPEKTGEDIQHPFAEKSAPRRPYAQYKQNAERYENYRYYIYSLLRLCGSLSSDNFLCHPYSILSSNYIFISISQIERIVNLFNNLVLFFLP